MQKLRGFALLSITLGAILAGCSKPASMEVAVDTPPVPALRQFSVKGVVKELEADSKTVIIQHEAISNYMAAMTMPLVQ